MKIPIVKRYENLVLIGVYHRKGEKRTLLGKSLRELIDGADAIGIEGYAGSRGIDFFKFMDEPSVEYFLREGIPIYELERTSYFNPAIGSVELLLVVLPPTLAAAINPLLSIPAFFAGLALLPIVSPYTCYVYSLLNDEVEGKWHPSSSISCKTMKRFVESWGLGMSSAF